MVIFIIVVLAAVIFEYSNGFHDAANAIATVVSTKVLTPRQAIAMAAFFNLTGALMGGAVASTVGKGLVDTNVVTIANRALRADRRLHLEHSDLVARASFQFEPCAHRRTVRGRPRHGSRKLDSDQVERRDCGRKLCCRCSPRPSPVSCSAASLCCCFS